MQLHLVVSPESPTDLIFFKINCHKLITFTIVLLEHSAEWGIMVEHIYELIPTCLIITYTIPDDINK